jgi:thymidylate synthase (FAD)
MTEIMWKIDLHNLLHFLRLRLDGHAQKEIRDLAIAIYRLITPVVPVSIKAFEDFRLNAITFSKEETDYLTKKTDLSDRKVHNLNLKIKSLKQ